MNQPNSKLKKQADQLLQQSQLATVLQKFGEPVFTGSYTYDLMTTGDIDIYLITQQDIHTTAKKLLRELAEQGWWNGYMLFDWVNWRRDYMLNGYYVGTKTDFAGSRWKVDIWVLPEFPAAQKNYNRRLLAKLNSTNRELILKIKQKRDEVGWPVDGKTIYDAVIKKQISSVDEFAAKFVE